MLKCAVQVMWWRDTRVHTVRCPGFFYMPGDGSPDIHGTDSWHGLRARRDSQSSMLRARFLHLTILVAHHTLKPLPLHYQAYMFKHSAMSLRYILLCLHSWSNLGASLIVTWESPDSLMYLLLIILASVLYPVEAEGEAPPLLTFLRKTTFNFFYKFILVPKASKFRILYTTTARLFGTV